MRLEATVIVVTGGAGGLGRAMVRGFVAEGAQVVGADVDGAGLEALAAELDDRPGTFEPVLTDVRSWDEVEQTVATTLDRFGRIDVLVNNAGVQQRTAGGDALCPVQDIPVEIWDAVLGTNLRGAFLCTKAALPGMLDRDAGRLIFVSSGAGLEGRPNAAAYGASKFGLEGFCACLSLELDGTGVESVVFRPPGGGVYTESRSYRDRDSYAFETPAVVTEPAVQLASGRGEHGRRYQGTPDGEGFVEEPR